VRSTHDVARRRAPGAADARRIASDRSLPRRGEESRIRRHWPHGLALIAWVATSGCPQLKDDEFSGHRLQADADASDLATDTTPPRVLGSIPENGAAGVSIDTAIEITFSEPMDRAATEAAVASLSIRRDRLTFSWRNAGTVLVIDPIDPLPHSSGTDSSVRALGHDLQISGAARDVAGNALVYPFEVAFTVQRELSQSFGVVKDRGLTGNFRIDGNYGILGCERVDTTICVGDSAGAPAESTYRGFLTFDLTALPATPFGISAATLDLTIALMVGAPALGLGTLELQRVDFRTIDAAAYTRPTRASGVTLASDGVAGDLLTVDALPSLEESGLDPGNRIQYRLAFAIGSNGNQASDLVVFDWSTPRLNVTYWVP
jgi:Big-like domain-containing protein